LGKTGSSLDLWFEQVPAASKAMPSGTNHINSPVEFFIIKAPTMDWRSNQMSALWTPKAGLKYEQPWWHDSHGPHAELNPCLCPAIAQAQAWSQLCQVQLPQTGRLRPSAKPFIFLNYLVNSAGGKTAAPQSTHRLGQVGPNRRRLPRIEHFAMALASCQYLGPTQCLHHVDRWNQVIPDDLGFESSRST
jgi:hypothetical protein